MRQRRFRAHTRYLTYVHILNTDAESLDTRRSKTKAFACKKEKKTPCAAGRCYIVACLSRFCRSLFCIHFKVIAKFYVVLRNHEQRTPEKRLQPSIHVLNILVFLAKTKF